MFSKLSSYQTLPGTPTAVKVKFKLISLLFKFFHICAQFIIIFFLLHEPSTPGKSVS